MCLCVCVYLLLVEYVSLCKMRNKDLSSKETQYLEQVLQQMFPHWILLSMFHISLITENLTQIRHLEKERNRIFNFGVLAVGSYALCLQFECVHIWTNDKFTNLKIDVFSLETLCLQIFWEQLQKIKKNRSATNAGQRVIDCK